MRLFAVLGICIAIVATAKVLIIRTHPVRPDYLNMTDAAGEAPEPPFSEITPADHSLPMIEPPTSATAKDSRLFAAKSYLPGARIPHELENAALAAGLVDPSRIDFAAPSPEAGQTEAQSDTRGSLQEVTRGKTSQLLSLAVKAPASSPSTTRTEPISASVASPPGPNEIASASPRRSAETDSDGSMPASGRQGNYGRGSRAAMKKSSLRLVARTDTAAPGNTAAQERKTPADYPRNENKPEPPTGQRTGDLALPPQDLSGDLQRFVSDFIRTDQSNSVADQHRFFADSVHFYGEGDLSWASVAAATRRYHQQRQTRRSEIAGPAATKGPVNGGFYVVEQPVVWTRAQGSQLTRGRSVFRLSVVPIDRGGWKITSIDEVNK